MRVLVLVMSVAMLLALEKPAQCKKTSGKFEVTAKLVKIPGKFPPDELYDYAFVMQYKVVEGKLKGKKVFVAHYKPRRARAKIKDKMKKYVGGKLKRFKEGDLHKLVLAPKMRKIWKGDIIDEFFATDRKSKRYWCLQADPAKTK